MKGNKGLLKVKTRVSKELPIEIRERITRIFDEAYEKAIKTL